MNLPFGPHGVLSQAAALAALGTYRLRTACETGLLIRPWPGVLVDPARAADPVTLAAAAVTLTAGQGVVAGPTAAYLHGCHAVAPTPVHLVVPYRNSLRTQPGLVVHNGPLGEHDRTERDGIPVLVLDRVVADLLAGRDGELGLAVADEALALQEPLDREMFRRAVARLLQERPDPRGTVRAARLLEIATGRAESPFESRLLFRIVDAGFPVPAVNWWLTDLDGRELYRLDLAWPQLRIAVEYHGYAAHAGRSAEDEERAEDVRRRGWLHVDVWSDDLVTRRYEGELDAAFRWRGMDLTRRRTGLLQARRHRAPSDRWRTGRMPRPVRLDG